MSQQTPDKAKMSTFVKEMSAKRWTFVLSFALVFLVSSSVLYMAGLTPEKQHVANSESGIVEVASAARGNNPQVQKESSSVTKLIGIDMIPRRVVIESVGIDVSISNPKSKDIAILDSALLSGAVRYPGSGVLDDNSNMFLFGHSSYLPVVHNQNFKAFNNLQKVKKGDIIRVESNDTVNIYRVKKVQLIDANEALVELSNREKKLTLSTCNSFGSPGERYIVEAEFVKSFTL